MDLNGKVILVTGGTGSFGRKFVETVLAKWRPAKLIVLSRDELKQSEMMQRFNGPRMRYFIGDVRDKERLYRAMRGVEIVVHAAALKQVPACEYNPFEAVKTNVLGSANVIDAAIDAGVRQVLAVSTDKAVNPINVYGATKLCAEKMFVQGNAYAPGRGTRFAVCRYGNVVGSRGSVVPLFLKQRENGALTITDARMTRFWLTIERGVEFAIQSLGLMRGGEIFVPKIPSVRIVDLARAIAPEREPVFTGIRPGEKIHEELLSRDEARHSVEQEDLFIVNPASPSWAYEPHKGEALEEGFSYESETNEAWLEGEALREALRVEPPLVEAQSG